MVAWRGVPLLSSLKYDERGYAKDRFQAIVVGAGGSGCVVARTLAEHGITTLLIDKGREPPADDGIGSIKSTITDPARVQTVITSRGVRTQLGVGLGGGTGVNLGIWIEERPEYFARLSDYLAQHNDAAEGGPERVSKVNAAFTDHEINAAYDWLRRELQIQAFDNPFEDPIAADLDSSQRNTSVSSAPDSPSERLGVNTDTYEAALETMAAEEARKSAAKTGPKSPSTHPFGAYSGPSSKILLKKSWRAHSLFDKHNQRHSAAYLLTSQPDDTQTGDTQEGGGQDGGGQDGGGRSRRENEVRPIKFQDYLTVLMNTTVLSIDIDPVTKAGRCVLHRSASESDMHPLGGLERPRSRADEEPAAKSSLPLNRYWDTWLSQILARSRNLLSVTGWVERIDGASLADRNFQQKIQNHGFDQPAPFPYRVCLAEKGYNTAGGMGDRSEEEAGGPGFGSGDIDGEIILTAGAMATPLLLLRSGVGPKEDLRRFNGVDPLSVNEFIGRNLQDRPVVGISTFLKNIQLARNAQICYLTSLTTADGGGSDDPYGFDGQSFSSGLFPFEELHGGSTAEAVFLSARIMFPPSMRSMVAMEFMFHMMERCSNHQPHLFEPLADCSFLDDIMSCLSRASVWWTFVSQPQSRGRIYIDPETSEPIFDVNYFGDPLGEDIAALRKQVKLLIRLIQDHAELFTPFFVTLEEEQCPIHNFASESDTLTSILDMFNHWKNIPHEHRTPPGTPRRDRAKQAGYGDEMQNGFHMDYTKPMDYTNKGFDGDTTIVNNNEIKEETLAIQEAKDHVTNIPFASFPQYVPDPDDDAAVDRFVKRYYTSMWHFVGSASLGTALNLNFQVKGINRVSVMDASALPLLTRMNPAATILAMARVAALRLVYRMSQS